MNKFEQILLTVFFIELFIGGGGRLVEFGFLSIRQVLFIVLFFTFLFRMVKEKSLTNPEVNTLIQFNPVSIGIYLLIGWFFVSSFIGFLNGHELKDVITDFLRVSFFGIYFPLAYYISDKRFSKKRIITILKYCALLVAVFTILISLLGKTVFLGNFEMYKQFLISYLNDDLVFRPGHGIFYKSDFYVFIGFILSLNAVLSKNSSRIDYLNMSLCALSLFWSETRGFLLAIMVSLLMIMVIDGKTAAEPYKGVLAKLRALSKNTQYIIKSIILLFIILSMPFLYRYMTFERYVQDNSTNSESITAVNDTTLNIRMEFILDSKEILLESPVNFIVGTGYGTEIAGRIQGIEMSFLDILVEQGIIGLVIWCYLFFLVFYYYFFAKKPGIAISNAENALVGAFLGVLLLTNTNPFINNPIGITFFLIMLIFSRSPLQKNR